MSGSLTQKLNSSKSSISLAEEAFVSLQKTADVSSQQVAATPRPYGISPTQYNVLRILRSAGADGMPCGDIGARMITRDPDVTRLLDRLESRGFTVRTREHKDRRVVTVRITPAGLDLLARLDAPFRAVMEELLGYLGRAELERLVSLLEAVCVNQPPCGKSTGRAASSCLMGLNSSLCCWQGFSPSF